MYREKLTYKQQMRVDNELARHKVKCKCGHTMILYRDYCICGHCGEMVYKDKKTEFIYKLKGMMK